MKILVYKWKAYTYADVCETFERLGHTLVIMEDKPVSYDEDPVVESRVFNQIMQEKCDFVFSMNYFAMLTKVCEKADIPYVIWTCDSPLISMYHENVFSPKNYFFIFDWMNYQEFKGMGVEHIWYLPLAVNTERIDYLLSRGALSAYAHEIAFVGSLYEKIVMIPCGKSYRNICGAILMLQYGRSSVSVAEIF